MKKTPPKSEAAKTYINPFRTCDADGNPVRFRFASALSLRDVHQKAVEEDNKGASARRGRILSLYEAKLPWDPVKLAAAGMKNKANLNLMGLAGKINARAGAVANLALDTTDLVELHPIDAERAGPDAEDIADVVAEEFSGLLRDSFEFIPSLATAVRERDLYGFGPLVWPDPSSFKPEAILRGTVKLAPNSPSLSARNELIMYETQLQADFLFGLFDFPEASEAAGWNLDAIKRYLVMTFVDGVDTQSTTQAENGTSLLEDGIAKLRQNRTFETGQFEAVRCIVAFAREVSGDRKISQYIIPAEASLNEFLRVDYAAYDHMDQCAIWLPATITENRAAGLRGIASFLAPLDEFKNIFISEMLDSARDGLKTVLVRDSAATPQEVLTLTEQGQHKVLPAGVQLAANPATQNIQPASGVLEMAARTVADNAAGSGAAQAGNTRVYSGADRRTKEEVMFQKQESDQTEQVHYVAQAMVFDSIFRESFRRLMALVADPRARSSDPEVKRFVARCEARGIPLDRLREVPKLFDVYMCRDLVSGGALAKAGGLADVFGLIGGNLDEKGSLDAAHDYVRARLGARAARRYRPKVGRDAAPSNSASHALLENNDMLELSPVLAAPDQMHWSHIPVHLQLLGQITESVQSGQVEDPQRMLDVFNMASEHVRAHAVFGGRQVGREDDAKALLAQLRGLRPVQQQLDTLVMNQERVIRAEEEKRQRQMEDLQKRADGADNAVKIHEIDTKAALKQREQDLNFEVQMRSASARAQVETFRAQMKAATDRVTAEYNRRLASEKAMGNQPPAVAPGAGQPGNLSGAIALP